LAKVPEQDRNPKLSVCLATCNGEKFVREQLMSILDQLGAHDEIIIVDDASEDHTKEIIAALDDDRIRLIENQQRQGVVRTFERAVRAASGDLLFLSDQDDIWAPNKVSRFVDAFDRNPEAMIVTSDIQTIDEFGNPLTDHIYSQSRPFTSSVIGNLISNRFQGAAMAFRSRILTQVLPFPEGFHLLHDAWIGTRNSATGGKAICLDEKLLLYRRHSGNASNRLHVAEQVLKRLRLLLALVTRWFKNRWTPTAGLP
jgi:glycosyltransferase involved in cell wall biosynthesis